MVHRIPPRILFGGRRHHGPFDHAPRTALLVQAAGHWSDRHQRWYHPRVLHLQDPKDALQHGRLQVHPSDGPVPRGDPPDGPRTALGHDHGTHRNRGPLPVHEREVHAHRHLQDGLLHLLPPDRLRPVSVRLFEGRQGVPDRRRYMHDDGAVFPDPGRLSGLLWRPGDHREDRNRHRGQQVLLARRPGPGAGYGRAEADHRGELRQDGCRVREQGQSALPGAQAGGAVQDVRDRELRGDGEEDRDPDGRAQGGLHASVGQDLQEDQMMLL
mmetsp:Transcript_8574/g.23223  ORF Transcript_8574/g.23223 Transcript_8574/m.23223 type:complete len:270 (+) Transcript_8574:321-1130(+)